MLCLPADWHKSVKTEEKKTEFRETVFFYFIWKLVSVSQPDLAHFFTFHVEFNIKEFVINSIINATYEFI